MEQNTTPAESVNSNDRVMGLLRLRGWTPQRLARRLPISASHISNMLAGRFRAMRWQRDIARLAGYTPAELWLDWLNPELREL